jgi:hypothetical protein
MEIVILCNQINCKFNKKNWAKSFTFGENQRLYAAICVHPDPQLSYNIREEAGRNCITKDERDDITRNDSNS